jgi:hypothetical protein
LGNRLLFIDISTLLTATPDPTQIQAIYSFSTPGEGGSHASWDPTTGLFYYSVYDTNYQGYLYVLDTSNLSAATPSIAKISKTMIGWVPHGISFSGIDGDEVVGNRSLIKCRRHPLAAAFYLYQRRGTLGGS